MLHILVIGTISMLVLCYFLFDRDLMHPASIFCLTFLVFEFFCMINAEQYQIKLEPETVIILIGGMILFVVCSFFFIDNTALAGETGTKTVIDHRQPIKISRVVMVVLIALQILAIFLFYQYLTKVYQAYYGVAGSISQKISLYNDLSKFSADGVGATGVKLSSLYNRVNLITSCVPYIIIAVLTYNFVLFKKLDILQIVSFVLLVVSMFLRGSRSPLFRIFTLMVFIIYFVKYREVVRQKRGVKFFVSLIIAFVVVGVLLYLSLYLMGRDGTENVSHKLFVYLGAPIDNLDNYIAQGHLEKPSSIFGEYTLSRLYSYFDAKGLIKQTIHTTADVLPFVKTANGNGGGNVATMYYFFLLDFGYWGIVPYTAVIALFYAAVYRRLLCLMKKGKYFSYSLVIYAYIFNDLIMLPFSNRFYENVVTVPMLKFAVIAWLFVEVFIEKKINILGLNLDFNNFLGGLVWNRKRAE